MCRRRRIPPRPQDRRHVPMFSHTEAKKRRGRPVSRVLSKGQERIPTPWATIHLEPESPPASRDPPRPTGRRLPSRHARKRARPAQLDLAPGGACRAAPVAGGAVGSCPTVSPLPARKPAVCSLWRCPSGSENLPRPGVTRRRASVEPGLSSSPRARSPRKRGRPVVRLLQVAAFAAARKPRPAEGQPSFGPPTSPSPTG